eukprot:gene4527-6392_t
MLLLQSHSSIITFSNPTGWIAAIGASITFGSCGIPFKSPALTNVSIDPLVFAISSSIGIFMVTSPLTIYLIATGQFVPVYIAVAASFDILVISFMAFHAIQELGYAKAPAVWASIGMVSSFLVGSLGFHEAISNIAAASLALPLLILGVTTILSCQNITTDSQNDDNSEVTMVTFTNNIHQLEIENNNNNNNIDDNSYIINDKMQSQLTNNKEEDKSKPNLARALLLCLCTGVCDGGLVVPYKLMKAKSLIDTFNYLSSFSIGSIIVAPMQLKLAYIPGVFNGILWACGNFMSVHATMYLGMKIGFPLTQTCVVFGALWGIFYFKEINIYEHLNYLRFSIGLVFIILGAYFLSISSE